jgi:hypothetical protein
MLTSMNFKVYKIAVPRLGISSSASSISPHAEVHLLLLLVWTVGIFLLPGGVFLTWETIKRHTELHDEEALT